MIDFSKTKIHASSLGKLFTPPKSVEDKKAGNLSASATTHLIDIYVEEKYGRKKDIETKGMRKGTTCEDESIYSLSEYIGEFCEKNEETLQNDYIIGIPDVRLYSEIRNKKIIYEVKSPETIHTFMPRVLSGADDIHFAQTKAYMWLDNTDEGYIVFPLTDLPPAMLEKEFDWFLKKNMELQNNPEQLAASWAKAQKEFVYQDIPLNEKILVIKVEKEADFEQNCKLKVEKAREFLHQFQEKHLNFNK